MSVSDDNYQTALEKVQVVEGSGFSKTTRLTAGDLSRKEITQNNTIIQLLIDIHTKLDTLKAESTVIKNENGKAVTEVNLHDDLIKKFEGLTLGKTPKQTKPGTLFAYKDPYVILEEEKNRLKTQRR